MIRAVELFAGIDGFGLGLERAGIEVVAQVEIDPFCNRVLERRYPHVKRFRDIREFGAGSLGLPSRFDEPGRDGEERQPRREREDAQAGRGPRDPQGRSVHAGSDGSAGGGEGRIDLITGGFPCQDLSVAGKRAGLAGARSGLFFEFVRVVREIQPRWLLLENVPGLLSSNGGRDFAVVLAELGDAGYFVEWRVLDARWFGVPQRRRRVFLVGHLGGSGPRSVLFEPAGGSGDPEASGEARSIAAGTLARSLSNVGGGNDYGANKGTLVSHALGASMGKGHDPDQDELVVSDPLITREGRTYTHEGRNFRTRNLIAPKTANALRRSDGYDSEDGSGRQPALIVESMALRGREGGIMAELGGDTAHALRNQSTGGASREHILTIQSANQPERKQNGDGISEGDMYSLTARDRHGVAFISENQRAEVRETDVSFSMATGGGKPGQGYPALRDGNSVRRLTPTECERLQGFPDGWTCLCGIEPYATASCRCPDGARYAAIGNAVSVPVAEWIGRQLVEADRA